MVRGPVFSEIQGLEAGNIKENYSEAAIIGVVGFGEEKMAGGI